MQRQRLAVHAATLLAALALCPGSALATNGYFAHAYGAKHKGMAGAGAALPLGPLDAATNPATVVFAGKRYDFGIAVFNPNRDYTVTGGPSRFPGTFGLVPGKVESGSRAFPVPHLGRTWMSGDKGAFALAVFGNGGMNTDYDTATFFGSAPTGVDLAQLFVAPTYAHKLGDKHAIGLSAMLAFQRFRVEGLQAFGAFSSSAANLTNNDHDSSLGAGARIGYYGEWSKGFSVAAAYQTKVFMSEFDKYAGLFAGQGDFDVPSNWVVGIAIKPSEDLAFVVDVQQVRYSEIASVGNPFFPGLQTARLGDDGAAGFGWQDMTTVKGGVQWRSSEGWTWRAGYSFGEQPIPATEVLFNILAPGVVEQHATLGVTRALGAGKELHLSAMRAFSQKVSGGNPLEAPGRQVIELRMDQWEFEVGFSFGF